MYINNKYKSSVLIDFNNVFKKFNFYYENNKKSIFKNQLLHYKLNFTKNPLRTFIFLYSVFLELFSYSYFLYKSNNNTQINANFSLLLYCSEKINFYI